MGVSGTAATPVGDAPQVAPAGVAGNLGTKQRSADWFSPSIAPFNNPFDWHLRRKA
jgi:hypothetical protein